jgi:hypothetical protein
MEVPSKTSDVYGGDIRPVQEAKTEYYAQHGEDVAVCLFPFGSSVKIVEHADEFGILDCMLFLGCPIFQWVVRISIGSLGQGFHCMGTIWFVVGHLVVCWKRDDSNLKRLY